MQEKPICCFREMIAESDSFIIGTHYDIHKVILTLIIATFLCSVSFAFLEFQGHLIITVTNLGTFPIYRFPCFIRFPSLCSRQLQILTPEMTSVIRNTQCRLEQLIFNQDTQFTFFNYRTVLVSQGVIHLCIILSHRTLIEGKTICSVGRCQFLAGFCHYILRFQQCRYHQQ